MLLYLFSLSLFYLLASSDYVNLCCVTCSPVVCTAYDMSTLPTCAISYAVLAKTNLGVYCRDGRDSFYFSVNAENLTVNADNYNCYDCGYCLFTNGTQTSNIDTSAIDQVYNNAATPQLVAGMGALSWACSYINYNTQGYS